MERPRPSPLNRSYTASRIGQTREGVSPESHSMSVPSLEPVWPSFHGQNSSCSSGRRAVCCQGPPGLCPAAPHSRGTRGLTLSPEPFFTLPVRPVSTSRDTSAKGRQVTCRWTWDGPAGLAPTPAEGPEAQLWRLGIEEPVGWPRGSG